VLQVTLEDIGSKQSVEDVQRGSLEAEDVTLQNTQTFRGVSLTNCVECVLRQTHFKAMAATNEALGCFDSNLQLQEVGGKRVECCPLCGHMDSATGLACVPSHAQSLPLPCVLLPLPYPVCLHTHAYCSVSEHTCTHLLSFALQVTFEDVTSSRFLFFMTGFGSLTAEDVTFKNIRAFTVVNLQSGVSVTLRKTHFKAVTVADTLLFSLGAVLQLQEVRAYASLALVITCVARLLQGCAHAQMFLIQFKLLINCWLAVVDSLHATRDYHSWSPQRVCVARVFCCTILTG
jgi:hypothetical protein